MEGVQLLTKPKQPHLHVTFKQSSLTWGEYFRFLRTLALTTLQIKLNFGGRTPSQGLHLTDEEVIKALAGEDLSDGNCDFTISDCAGRKYSLLSKNFSKYYVWYKDQEENK